MVRVPAESKPRDDKPITAQRFTFEPLPDNPDFTSIVSALFEQDSFFDIGDDGPEGSALEFYQRPGSAASQRHQESDSVMAPPRQNLLPKDRFALAFGGLKTQTYHDPIARAPGSHTIRTIAWNPLGQLIATGSADRTLRIWNPERPSAKYSTELRGHSAGIEKVVFNPVRDAELASCSTDGTVRFWDVRSKNCVSRLDVGGEPFTLSWSADGMSLVVGRKDNTLIPIAVEHPSFPTIHPDGTITQDASAQGATGSTTGSNSTTYTALEARPQPVQTNGTAFNHHIRTPENPKLHLITTTGEGHANMVTYPTFDVIRTLKAHASSCLCVGLSPNGRYIATGGSDALITLWDTTDLISQRTMFSEYGGAVRGLSWSFDGRYICGACDEVGCGGNGLEIFHAETGESVYTVPTGGGMNTGIPDVAWHPTRYWLAYSITADGPGGVSSPGLKIVGAAGGGL